MARKKVTSVPALADWGAVDNALRDIRECQHTLAEMAVQRDHQIDSIKADYAQGALPLQNRVKALESEVKAYVDLHRAELDGKSRALNFGTVGYRVSSKLMLASSRVAEAIATLKVLGHTELIKTTETLVKGPGSVNQSMKWLQGLAAIVIDPHRCPDTAKEFSEYEYEVGRDGTVLPGYVDADNHHIDAVRYAVNRIWMRRGA